MNKFFNLINIHRAVFFIDMFINNISVYIFAGMCHAIIDENMPDILSFPTSWKKSDNIIPHYSFNCARSTRKYTFEDISKVSSYVFYIAFMENIILFFVDIIIIFFPDTVRFNYKSIHSLRTSFMLFNEIVSALR